MKSAEPVAEIRGLSVDFGDKSVLKDVRASFRRGEISVVLGASGSGKTTILKHLLGLLRGPAGTVSLFGTDLAGLDDDELRSVRIRLGMLFQAGALLNSISVFENVRIPLEQHTRMPAALIDAVAQTKLSLVGLEGSGGALPSELSGGMKKRAALARAMALDPELLLCDEPSSGLDPLTSASLDSLLLNLRDQLGMTIIVISHDIESVERIADRVFFLHQGSILVEGSLTEVRSSGLEAVNQYFSAGSNSLHLEQ